MTFRQKTKRITGLMAGGAIAAAAVLIPTTAQAGVNLNFGGEREGVQPRISTDGENLNLELEERRRPETQVEIRDGGVNIEQTRPEPDSILNITTPLNEDEEPQE